ncbi:MAG TPA: hypothetical protein PLD46_08775 [Hyphomicrobium sp.]|nr:hypothetical protein [Hyphomicrobium sp.]
MPLFRAGMAVAAMLIGAIAAVLGIVLLWSALHSGSISLSYGSGANVVSETISQASDGMRYWQLVIALGLAPAMLGTFAAIWGWRAIRR